MRFYFDFISPYAYLAWTQIHDVAARHGQNVEPVPILFAALLNHWGHKGPAEIPPKREYVLKDTLRIAAALGVPLAPPPSHPFNPLAALRVSCLSEDASTRKALITALFDATWGSATGVESAEDVEAIARSVGVANAMQRATTPETKTLLKANTQDALDAGVFGVPSVVCDGELFWGVDSLAHLDRYLAGDDPLSEKQGLLDSWKTIQASANRR